MNKKLYSLSIISGVLLALSFPPLPLFFLAFFAFIPLLYSFNNLEIKRPYLLIYITFFIYHSGTNWWIGSWTQDSDPYLTASSIVLAFVHPFFFMIPFVVFFFISKRISKKIALNLFPFIWVAYEWFHNLGELSYPWLTVGNTQIYNYFWIQFIDITGVWGASFLIVLINILFLKLFEYYKKFDWNNFYKNRNVRILTISLFLCFILPMIYGYFRIEKYDINPKNEAKNRVNIGIVQPAINPWRKWEMSVDEMVQIQKNISDSLINTKNKPDLIIWNETAIPRYIIKDDFYSYRFLSNWSDYRNTSLMSGFAELKYFNTKNKTVTARQDTSQEDTFYESYNACLLINPNDPSDLQVYQKMRLTPMAERLPYSEILLFMRSWFEWGVGISAWGIGTNQHNLILKKDNKSISVGPVICIESIYPEFVSKTSANGAEFIVIITNDAWYDNTPGPEQHFLIAAMRAIENRKFIARCANTGVSGIISPTGKTSERIPQYTRMGLNSPITLLKEKTLYVLYGDWFSKISLLITIFAIIYSIKKNQLLKKNDDK